VQAPDLWEEVKKAITKGNIDWLRQAAVQEAIVLCGICPGDPQRYLGWLINKHSLAELVATLRPVRTGRFTLEDLIEFDRPKFKDKEGRASLRKPRMSKAAEAAYLANDVRVVSMEEIRGADCTLKKPELIIFLDTVGPIMARAAASSAAPRPPPSSKHPPLYHPFATRRGSGAGRAPSSGFRTSERTSSHTRAPSRHREPGGRRG